MSQQEALDSDFVYGMKFMEPQHIDFVDTLVAHAKTIYGTTEGVLFAEFGSRQFSHPRRIPYSPAISHYFSLSEHNYVCFDAQLTRELFALTVPAFTEKLLEIIPSETYFYFNSIANSQGGNFRAEDFLHIGLFPEAYFGETFDSKEKLQAYCELLPKILEVVDKSTKDYEGITTAIAQAKKPLVFSSNVLSNVTVKTLSKGLDHTYPFWRIPNAYHVHRVHVEEISELVGGNPGKKEIIDYFGIESEVEFKGLGSNLADLCWQS